MTVFYDASLKKLIYDRKLRLGPGDNMYGLEVCKSLDLPIEFLDRAHSLRNKYQNDLSILEQKTSKYNSDKIKDPVQIFDNFYKFSYLDDRVIHYKLEGARHGLDPRFEKVRELVKSFIEN